MTPVGVRRRLTVVDVAAGIASRAKGRKIKRWKWAAVKIVVTGGEVSLQHGMQNWRIEIKSIFVNIIMIDIFRFLIYEFSNEILKHCSPIYKTFARYCEIFVIIVWYLSLKFQKKIKIILEFVHDILRCRSVWHSLPPRSTSKTASAAPDKTSLSHLFPRLLIS